MSLDLRQLVTDKCPDAVFPAPGALLGSGFHGQVFQDAEDPERVIKLSRTTKGMCFHNKVACNPRFAYVKLKKILNILKTDYYPFAKAHSYGFLFGSSRAALYFTSMEKLLPTSEDEKKVLTTICADLQCGKYEAGRKNAFAQSYWLDINRNKLDKFINGLELSIIHHNDLSVSNIMKDKFGNFKLIDFDFATLKRSINKNER